MATLNSSFEGITSILGLPLSGLQYIHVAGKNLSTGDNDLYTVPAGRKAMVISSCRMYQASGGNILSYLEVKSSGVYYPITASLSFSTGTGAGNTVVCSSFVFEAGESIAVNVATNNGLNIVMSVIEFDASVPLQTARSFNLSNGNNTLLTVTTGKSVAFPLSLGGSASSLEVVNFSGGAVNCFFYSVNSGSSADATNKFAPASSCANLTQTAFTHGGLNSGDALVVNTDSGTAGQHAYVTYFEI